MRNDIPDGCFVVGNKLMGKCKWCCKLVQVNKWIFGSLHVCVTEGERAMVDDETTPQK